MKRRWPNMPMFNYTALNASGGEIKGRLQSSDESSAAATLRDRGLRLIEMKKGRSKSGFLGQANFSDWLASQRSVSNSSLVFFFRQLSFMLRAGLSVTGALELALKQVSSSRLNLVIRLMLSDIESGKPLSVAMAKHKDVFPGMAVNLMVAGETTGDLDSIMDRLAVHLEKKAALKAQTINAMIYPSVVVLAAIGVFIFMVVKIIPKFSEFLLAQGKVLPPSTQLLIDISDYVRTNGLVLFGCAIAVIVTILVTYQFPKWRLTIDSILLRIPVVGSTLKLASMAQMTWALSILLRSGVTVFDALKITGKLLGNRVYSSKLIAASDDILKGNDMASSIEHRQMPPLVTQMIAVGEGTGSLDNVLQELGIYYEQLLEIAIKRMSALIEPAMILIIGTMVGFVYYAFFQALFSLVG
jgi:type IV pilus assembly protein PilC